MPAFRPSTVGPLLAAGLIAAGVAIKAPSGYAALNTSLVVSPDRGSATTQFTVTYRWPSTTAKQQHGNPHTCTPDHITFQWDGSPLGRTTATTAGNACVAELRAAPPPGPRQGPHTITVDADSSARATYTIAARPAGAATTSTATTPQSTAEAVTDPQATGSQDVPASSSSSSPDSTGKAAVAAGRKNKDQGWPAWYVAVGMIQILAGALAFGAVVRRTRRARAAGDVVRLPRIGDTEPLSLRASTARRPAHRRSG